jgi:hypothetical protein
MVPMSETELQIQRVECAAPVSLVISSIINYITSLYLMREYNKLMNE